MKKKTEGNSKRIDLDRGYCYIVKEDKPHLSYNLFEKLTTHSQGLCITRIYPRKLGEKVSLRNSNVIWLSHMPGENRCHPSALSSLVKIIFNVLEKNGIVLVDGLEYLVIQNGFNQALLFVEHVNEFAMQKRGVVLIPINPKAFNQRELALLERNLNVVEGPLDLKRKDISSLIEEY